MIKTLPKLRFSVLIFAAIVSLNSCSTYITGTTLIKSNGKLTIIPLESSNITAYIHNFSNKDLTIMTRSDGKSDSIITLNSRGEMCCKVFKHTKLILKNNNNEAIYISTKVVSHSKNSVQVISD
jgi:hypothetical protein